MPKLRKFASSCHQITVLSLQFYIIFAEIFIANLLLSGPQKGIYFSNQAQLGSRQYQYIFLWGWNQFWAVARDVMS